VSKSGSMPSFAHFTISDNTTASFVNADWGQSTGPWSLDPTTGTLAAQGPENKIYRQNAGSMAQLGDGGYTATIRLNNSNDSEAWGGVNIANASMSNDWGAGGYLVFIRLNGNLGVFKAGAGQLVPDVPTGVNPVSAPVRLRILKSGAYVRVYVNDQTQPVVNFWDRTGSVPVIGGWGLATRNTTGSFTDLRYAGNYGI
jgi:hypothetical protein